MKISGNKNQKYGLSRPRRGNATTGASSGSMAPPPPVFIATV